MRLILVRHGESEGNASGIVQGHLDFGLTALGRMQAHATAEHLARMTVDRLISSPLRRAAETASIIAGAVGRDVEHERGLMEYDMGAASGLTRAQIRERFPEVIASFQKGLRPVFPGEEGRDAFRARVEAVVDAFHGSGETVVMVAHGGVIGAVCQAVVGMPATRRGAFESANCSITEVALDRAGRRVLLRQNDTCHLDVVTSVDRG